MRHGELRTPYSDRGPSQGCSLSTRSGNAGVRMGLGHFFSTVVAISSSCLWNTYNSKAWSWQLSLCGWCTESYLHSYYKLVFWTLTPLRFLWLAPRTPRVITWSISLSTLFQTRLPCPSCQGFDCVWRCLEQNPASLKEYSCCGLKTLL